LLSVAWLVRKSNITDADYLTYRYGVSREDAAFVIEHVADGCYSHEEFYKLLKESKQTDKPILQLDRAS
jgi:hypothetical protein